ncbi:hypothetical protein OROMI_026365 [Orobanche minor]
MKIKGSVHGHLNNLDNYRLSFDRVVNKGIGRKVVTVHFVNPLKEEESDSKEKTTADRDMMQVMDVIFQQILGGVVLPRVWQSLYNMMHELATENLNLYRTMCKEEISSKVGKLKDHFSFWDWTDTIALYNRLWSMFHFIMNEDNVDGEITPEIEADLNYYLQVHHVIKSFNALYMKESSSWYDVIPKDSPWERFLRANGYGRSALLQLRYVQSLLQHYSEKVCGSQALKYFKMHEITESTHDQYVEMVVCECFFPFL